MQLTAHGFLLAGHKILLMPLIIVGYFTVKRTQFSKAFFILLFTLVLNSYLKSLWQIPLAPHLGKGFAFPSGPMQMAVAFWGWLAWEFRNPWLFVAVLIMLTGMGYSSVYYNYDNYIDVVGAALFAIISLFIYYFICKTVENKKIAIIGFILLIMAIPLLLLNSNVNPNLWLAIAMLTGFSTGLYLKNEASLSKDEDTFVNKGILKILVALSGAVFLEFRANFCLQFIDQNNVVTVGLVKFVVFFAIAFWVSFLTEYLVERKNWLTSNATER